MPIFTVKIRGDLGRGVKPETEQINGKTYRFEIGWVMDKNDPYPGETAYISKDPAYPLEAPCWIASGDLMWTQ